MIKITDWQNVNWVDGETYQALVGYDGELPITAHDVIVYMGSNLFDGLDDRSVTAYNYLGITIVDGIYKNAPIGIYAKRQISANRPDGSLPLSMTIKGRPQFYNCGIGIKLFGSDCKVFGAYMDGLEDDGMWIEGDNCEVGYCQIKNVDLGSVGGDCIQFAASNNPHIHHNVLDHSNKDTKQALIIGQGKLTESGEFAEGALIEHNTLIGGKYVLQCKNNGMRVRKNTIIAGNNTARIINFGFTDRILTEENYIIANGLNPYSGYRATNVINRDVIA